MSESNSLPPEVTEEVPAARPSMIGRQEELEVLIARIGEVQAGRGGIVGIRGDSGLGKTHLVREVAARAEAAEVRAVLIPCRGTLHRAFSPLAGLVRAVLNISTDYRSREQFAQLEFALTELEVSDPDQTLPRLLNILSTRSTGSLEEQPTDSEDHFDDSQVGQRALVALPDTLAALLGAVTRRDGPLCAIFDDLDETHPQTIGLFQKLIETTSGLPILFVASMAPNAPDDLKAAVEADLMTLSNLPEEHASALGASMLGARRLSASLAELLWATAAGDPLFITLLARELMSAGRVRLARGEASVEGEELPSTLVQLITRQAATLADSRRDTLDCAAILTDGFRTGALSTLRGRVLAADLEADLSELIETGWLDRNGTGRHISYVFTNRIRRSVIYNDIPEERQAELHKTAGDYYAVVSAGNRVRVEKAIYHYLRSGDTRRALPVVEIAINKARSTSDREQLAALYMMGIEVASTDASLSSKQIEMAERLGDLYASDGDFARAVDVYTRYSPPVTTPEVLGKLGLVTLAVDPARAANILSRSLSVISGGKEDDSRWMFEASLCWALSISGNNYEAIRRCRDSLGKLGDTVGFGDARTTMRAVLGMILFYDGDIHEANPHLESARAGWGARGKQDGILLINQVLISMPKQDITRLLVKMMMAPLLKE